MVAAAAREAPATLAGLAAAPCDPLVLAVGDAPSLGGLTGAVDWRLAGRLSRHVQAGDVADAQPLLLPRSPLLPVGRLVLLRVGALSPEALVARLRWLGPGPIGLCPADFGWRPQAVRAAFGAVACVLYGERAAGEAP